MKEWQPWNEEWSEEQIGRLKELAATGISYAAIGRAMGITKNAVVAKANRIGLPRRKPGWPESGERKAMAPPPPKPEPVLQPAPPARTDPGIHLEQLQPDQCRYPMWSNDERMSMMFCGFAVEPGTPWCPDHGRLVHPAGATALRREMDRIAKVFAAGAAA